MTLQGPLSSGFFADGLGALSFERREESRRRHGPFVPVTRRRAGSTAAGSSGCIAVYGGSGWVNELGLSPGCMLEDDGGLDIVELVVLHG